jgi:hypothetical protein
MCGFWRLYLWTVLRVWDILMGWDRMDGMDQVYQGAELASISLKGISYGSGTA